MNISAYVLNQITKPQSAKIPLASFQYGKEKKVLIPEDMELAAHNNMKNGVRRSIYKARFESGLSVELEMKQYDDFGAVDWVIAFHNEGKENTLNISKIMTADIHLPSDEELAWRSIRGDICGSESFMPVRRKIVKAEPIVVAPVGGKPSNGSFPFFDILGQGNGLICAIGWSGQWKYEIIEKDSCVALKAGLFDADFYLKPGETVRTVRMLIMPWEGDWDDAHNQFRKLMKGYFSPRSRFGDSFRMPAAMQNFCRYIWFSQDHPEWSTEKGQLDGVKTAADIGLYDAYWIDAMWFEGGFPKGVGNFSFKKVYPRGLKPIADAIHQNNMKLILWFEPERISEGTELFSASPDWLITVPYSSSWEETLGPDTGDQKLFNLGVPEAREWLTDKISEYIEANGVDIYRQDLNIDPLEFWDSADEADRKGLTEIKYIMGLYKFWDDLLARFPQLLIDNCASGGRRIDLETSMRSVPLWRSDTGSAPRTDENPKDLWNQNQSMGLSGYIPYHAVNNWSMVPYEYRSAFTMGFTAEFDVLSPDMDFEKAKAVLAEFRRVREYWEGNYYALTEPNLDKKHWAAYQLDMPEKGCGMAMIFRRDESSYSRNAFKFRGIVPDRAYKLRLTDEKMAVKEIFASSRELLDGYEFMIENPKGSLLVEYKAV